MCLFSVCDIFSSTTVLYAKRLIPRLDSSPCIRIGSCPPPPSRSRCSIWVVIPHPVCPCRDHLEPCDLLAANWTRVRAGKRAFLGRFGVDDSIAVVTGVGLIMRYYEESSGGKR